MNYLSVILLVGVVITISFGYKTNCTTKIGDPCVVYLTPKEDAYQKLLESVDSTVKMLHGLGLSPNETDQNKIDEENKKIKEHVDEAAIKRFIGKLKDVTQGYDRSVVLVLDLNTVIVPSDITTTPKATTSMSWNDIYGKRKGVKPLTKVKNFFKI